MDFNDYQQAASETAVYPGKGTVAGLSYVTLGLVGEAGELANKVKKILRDDAGAVTQQRRDELIKEMGDVLWYLAMMATELRALLRDVATANVLKLAQRKAKGTLHGEGDGR